MEIITQYAGFGNMGICRKPYGGAGKSADGLLTIRVISDIILQKETNVAWEENTMTNLSDYRDLAELAQRKLEDSLDWEAD